ncbi:MAG: glycosyltransferase [Geobacter sp.]|nr:MAG: glycosyltransferase [Geobacter sp.]
MQRTSEKKVSILIPVYNWDLSLLLNRLLREIDECRLEDAVEVIVLDDHSSDEGLRAKNGSLVCGSGREYLHYDKLERNMGRSAVRNLLAAKASARYLLFLDCDVLPDEESFIRSYLAHADAGEFDVVCGGISYRTRVLNGTEYDYHAYLGNKKEVKPAAQRNLAPWRHILTSNIMVRKSVFVGTPFDERFTGYGYEDIEWGVRLARSYRILHIDNTASHLGLVTKDRAYAKMRDSVVNYLLLRQICPEAFEASTVATLVRLLRGAAPSLLQALDRTLGRCFLSCRFNDRLAFVLFQCNFAVLLALASKPGKREGDA